MNKIRVTCDCTLCGRNAARLGVPTPLRADVNPKMAAALGITPRNADKASRVHGLVHLAHDPVLRRSAQVITSGPWSI